MLGRYTIEFSILLSSIDAMLHTIRRFVLTTAAMLTSIFSFAAAFADQPNIVLIMVDDMGYGDSQCYNSKSKIRTPNIDSLARDGMRFTDAHAPGPLCHLSRYGLLTGQYPFRADTKSWRTKASIAPDQITIASLLRENGYRTSMVGKWHLGFDEDGYDKPLPGGPVDRGFDNYFGIRASTDIPPYFYISGDRVVDAPTNKIKASNSDGWTRIQGEFWRAGGIAPNLALQDVLPRFTNEAMAVIDGHAKSESKSPLFLYLAYPAPHTPWLPSNEFVGKSGASMYGDFAMMVDHHVGQVLGRLDSANLSDNTLVIFTSDNGPVWYDKDVKRFGHDSSGGLRGMKADAWEGGHRMPFIARWPGKVKAGSRCDQLICFTDMLATFAELNDVRVPADAGPDSFSILSLLKGDNQPVRPSIAMQAGSGMMMVRQGDWKLIEGLGSGGFSEPKRVRAGKGDPPGQLYNLAEDIGEAKNLYNYKPKIVESLTAELKRIQTDKTSR